MVDFFRPGERGVRFFAIGHSPSHDDEEVKAVPGVAKVTFGTKHPQGHHFNHHLHGKEGKYEVIERLREEKKPQGVDYTWKPHPRSIICININYYLITIKRNRQPFVCACMFLKAGFNQG